MLEFLSSRPILLFPCSRSLSSVSQPPLLCISGCTKVNATTSPVSQSPHPCISGFTKKIPITSPVSRPSSYTAFQPLLPDPAPQPQTDLHQPPLQGSEARVRNAESTLNHDIASGARQGKAAGAAFRAEGSHFNLNFSN